jgi:hypothetical protein
MVVGIFMLLKHFSLYRKFRSCSYFIYPCLLLCASLIYFLTRFLCIGSGLYLNVFYIYSLMLSFASIHISYVSIFSNYRAQLKGVKEKHSWEITQCFHIQFFFFYLSLGSYYYCNNLSLSFLFCFCAKRSLQFEWGKIWGCCCPETVFGATP